METPENKKKEPASLDAQREKTPGFSRPLLKGMETARVFRYEEHREKLEKARWQLKRKKLIEHFHLPSDATDDDIDKAERAERGANKEIDQEEFKKWMIDHGTD